MVWGEAPTSPLPTFRAKGRNVGLYLGYRKALGRTRQDCQYFSKLLLQGSAIRNALRVSGMVGAESISKLFHGRLRGGSCVVVFAPGLQGTP
jgi:hypothetical protein